MHGLSARGDDIPLSLYLSEAVFSLQKKRHPKGCLFFWSRVRESNLVKLQLDSLTRCWFKIYRLVCASTYNRRFRYWGGFFAPEFCMGWAREGMVFPSRLIWAKRIFSLQKEEIPERVSLLFGAGYGSRTRLIGLGSPCTTDVLTLRFI